MSYPLSIQSLIIEDEEVPKESYERIFSSIAAEYTQLPFRPAPPLFAFSHEEGLQKLASSKMFHLVILDLRLPKSRRLPAPDGIDLGLDLLSKASSRTQFPIPSLLIVSGHVAKTEQERVQQALRDDFHYGRMFVKGDLQLLEKEVRHAFAEAVRYCSVGIHLRDAELDQYPTVSPDEDDLLRRCVLQTEGTVGLDLSWWDAELHGTSALEWTKILIGRFLLADGQGASRSQFFKLFAGDLAASVHSSARQIERKLSHIKVVAALTRKSRALITTEKVGATFPRPVALEEYLKSSSSDVGVRSIVEQVNQQLEQLGDSSPQSCEVSKLLWRAHDLGRIRRQWDANGGPPTAGTGEDDPVSLFAGLLNNTKRVRFEERSMVHGDLHIRNVALDNTNERVEAYIFDSASSIGRYPKGRDLASLEVSLLLHQAIPPEVIINDLIPALYGTTFVPVIPEHLPNIAAFNTLSMIRRIRETITSSGVDEVLFGLMVLDYTMVQLGGLDFGTSHNKIRHPQVVVPLAAATARWFKALAQDSSVWSQ
jgi:CheY-like chemotaxis protein